MNKVIITGRLTNKPELKYTPSNNAIATFTVACNRQKKQDGTQETDFIKCRVWNKQAENLCKYQDKGSLVLVDGQLRVDSYTDKEGNKTSRTYVLANTIEYLQVKTKEQTPQTEKKKDNTDIFEQFGEEIDINDKFLD